MPSRTTVALVLLFWVVTLGVVFYTDLWPRLTASGPPPIAVDLSDEASQLVPVRWNVLRGEEKVGRLTTRMIYVDADDTFRFVHQYSQVQIDIPPVRVVIPELTTVTRVTRAGSLREQSMTGKLAVLLRKKDGADGHDPLAEARAEVDGRVVNGVFVGTCDLSSPLGNVTRDLAPVPVPDGQALNPLQPLNRVANVRPGQRWHVHEIDPLKEAVAAVLQERFGRGVFGLFEQKREPLLAEVRPQPEALRWGKEGDVSCWVIDYRAGDARARTWVRVADGKVLRQEAFGEGERVALVREE